MLSLKQTDVLSPGTRIQRAVATEIVGKTIPSSISAGIQNHTIQRKPIIQRKPGEDEEFPIQRMVMGNQKNTAQAFAYTNGNNTHAGPAKTPFLQPKLSVNTPGDQYEQEADAMADKVMRMPVNDQPFFSPNPAGISHVQRKCAHCEEEEKLQRKENTTQPTEASSETSSYINSLSSKGSPLSESTRSFFEPRFGRDFSDVKIHNDSVAAKSADSINALAYTTGNNIVFNQNQFSPESDSGKKLLAHELTHVMQQSQLTKSQLMLQRGGAKASADATKVQAAKDKLKAKYGLKGVKEENGVAWNTYSGTGSGIVYCESTDKQSWYQCGTIDDPELIQQQQIYSDNQEALAKLEAEERRTDEILAKGSFEHRFKNLIADDYYSKSEEDLFDIGRSADLFLDSERKQVYAAIRAKKAAHGDKVRDQFSQLRRDSDIAREIAWEDSAPAPKLNLGMMTAPVMLEMGGFAAAASIGSQVGEAVNDVRGCVNGIGNDCGSLGITLGTITLSHSVLSGGTSADDSVNFGTPKEIPSVSESDSTSPVNSKPKANITEVSDHSATPSADKPGNIKGSNGPKKTRQAVDPEIARLKKLAKTDVEATTKLQDYYEKLPIAELRKAAKSNALAKYVLSEKILKNNGLEEAMASEYRPPHEATAVVRDADNAIVWSDRLKSGNMTDIEKALGFPKNTQITHTEARAIQTAPLAPGSTLSITGQYDPCSACQEAMQIAANDNSVTIRYWWPGGEVIFKPKSK